MNGTTSKRLLFRLRALVVLASITTAITVSVTPGLAPDRADTPYGYLGFALLLTITGRRSGRSLTVPVGYLRYGGASSAPRAGNGAPGGRTFGGRPGDGARSGEAYLAEFPATARRRRVGLDPDGRPAQRDVEAAFGEGRAVMVVGSEVPKAC